MVKRTVFAILGVVLSSVATTPAKAASAVVGINVVHPQSLTVAQENDILDNLKAAGVHVIRTGITPDDKTIGFVKRAYAIGIKVEWITSPKFPPDAPSRPYRPQEWPGMWAGPPLSYASADLSRSYFQALFDRLDGEGVQLAAVELGNEINGASFNPEFPLPGEGKQFGLRDLQQDPEGRQIARGYLQYLKILKVLKDVRDHSKLNRVTPILSAGLVAYEAPEGPFGKGATKDMVGANATLEFWRSNGLDALVDGYAVHVHPWANGPGQADAAAGRRSRLKAYVLKQCRPPGSADGKPCWLTEWGFKNTDAACPAKETDQVALVREMRDNFRPYVDDGRLKGLIYYAWIDTSENFGVYRCGALLETGRLAIAPMN
jgi:hypothetical protein